MLSPEELRLPKPESKQYLTKRQLFQGLRKPPGWYGWKTLWGGFTASPNAPPPGTAVYWRFQAGQHEERQM